MEIAYAGAPAVLAELHRIGATEDVQFSPDGTRLALAGAGNNRLLLIGSDSRFNPERGLIKLTSVSAIRSAAFAFPHGLSWLDNETLAVANREGGVAICAAPAGPGRRLNSLSPLAVLGGCQSDLIAAPGSVVARSVGMGFVELLTCSAALHNVSRQLVDQRHNYAVLASAVLIEEGLDLPDGIARTSRGDWVAVSNHNHHCVSVFRSNTELGRRTKAGGVLRGVRYPHGLRFAADGKSLFVADTGAPFVHHFKSPTGNWDGVFEPTASVRVMDDDTFERGRCSSREGGPKGIDLTSDSRLMATTCEERPLAFFDLSEFDLEPNLPAQPEATDAEVVRTIMLGLLSAARSAPVTPSAEAEALRAREIHRLLNCRSMRLTAPLRTAARQLRWIVRRAMTSSTQIH